MEKNNKSGQLTIINPELGDTTEINPNLAQDSQNDTVINPEVLQNAPNFTEINPIVSSSRVELVPGTVIGKGYVVQEPLHQNSGEAILYICTYRNRQYVAKIYRRNGAIKDEVIDALKTINSTYVAKLYETGVWNGSPYEILPYYKYGSLEGRTFSFETLEKVIIPELNAGLRALHKKGIIHKDLKPANIMLCDNQQDIAIIDFGISSVREEGNTVVMTKTGMTPEYSASETFRNLFLEESDYYSLGITLFELYCGRTPYAGMSKDEIEQFVSVQKIPFPNDMPERLKALIVGLTYNDITNRKDKNNPNRRWTYDEVNKWCKGEKLPAPGGNAITSVDIPMQPYTFYRKKYYRLDDLAYAMAMNWENGKKHLYRSTMSEFFKKSNPDIANICIDAEETVGADRKKADITFFKVLYQMAPDMEDIIWKGINYGTLESIGKQILSGSYPNEIEDMLAQGVFSAYLSSRFPEKINLSRGMEAAEYKYRNSEDSMYRQMVQQLLGRYMAKDSIFIFEGMKFESLEEFAIQLIYLRQTNQEQYERWSERIIIGSKRLLPTFEAWLIIHGKNNEIDLWRNGQ
ncbi:protein kinase domain-containing protein [Lacrimispora sp. 210928-DFI.3.58]|uniref:protein kinase domain-containing protein n=1 Tax=Lacrimispora sp. 210928-DFI.3.58 TaxID=2883214 RepID=UPI001D07DBD4|nr:protein kinase [Lacrimispora sp. 210928-DFI.3.58]MCB7320461.1 protein kinase [Lacrimispora sp. 210928-DFI.3.58]